MNERSEKYEKYPGKIVCASSIISLLSVGFGFWIIYSLSPIFAGIYLALALIDILAVCCFRCRHCSYYGKLCATGYGRIAGMIFEKGHDDFLNKKNLIVPFSLEIILMLIPGVIGAYLLYAQYSLTLLIIYIAYLVVALLPNFYLRQKVYCQHCQQGERGCPAYNSMRGVRKYDYKY